MAPIEPVSDAASSSSASRNSKSLGVGVETTADALSGEKSPQARYQGTFDNADLDGKDTRFYKPIPTYEGLHRGDPTFEWEEKEEKRLIRSVSHLSTQFHDHEC